MKNQLRDKLLSKHIEDKKGMEPVYKGCPNRVCHCTGICKEIVGWRKENDNPIILN